MCKRKKKENLAKQQTEQLKQLKVLQQINTEQLHSQVGLGTLVQVKGGQHYFLATSLGAVPFEGSKYFVISPVSPIGQQLAGKQVGDAFTFNKRNFTIKALV